MSARAAIEKVHDSFGRQASALWFKVRHSRLVDNIVALYVVQFANYLVPLIIIPYVVRVLTPSGYGLGTFAISFASFFGTIAEYGSNLTASRAVAVGRANLQEVSRIATEVMFARIFLWVNCAGVFWILISVVPKLQGNKLIMWMGFLYFFTFHMNPIWLYQGLEELRFSARVSLGVRFAFLPLLFLVVRHPADTWKWVALQTAGWATSATILWLYAYLRLGVRCTRPHWRGLGRQLREGFSLFVSQAAVKAYAQGNTFILGMFTNVVIAGYYNAAEKIAEVAFTLLNPIVQAVYPRASRLAAASRHAALHFMRKTLMVMGSGGFAMSACLLAGAPWIVSIGLGPKYHASITILRILSPLPCLVALTNVLGTQIMVPFKHDLAYTVILVSAGVVNLTLAALLAPRWHGNGMAVSVTFSQVFVATTMLWYLGRRRLSPLGRLDPQAASL